jgi:lipopolysaccharide transport system ATP-binding protein
VAPNGLLQTLFNPKNSRGVSFIIKVSNLGKKYIITHNTPRRHRNRLFSENLSAAFTWPVRILRTGRNGYANSQPKREEFWALRDIDFEVEPGEVVGIIGRNGAGKSTLLKLLSRITDPTTGRIALHGRIASLLEVGTGFHPELTGRENIFLNGAILGMSRADIKRKFDEIVAFAEVEKFLDTPVKRYSSGMHVRLGFAVAAHLEPEILIVDEVLAVGDAEFQKKCLGKIENVSHDGRTVLFVSHNIGAVSAITSRALVLAAGKITFNGPTANAIEFYNNVSARVRQYYYIDDGLHTRPAFSKILVRQRGRSTPPYCDDQPIQIEFCVECCSVRQLAVGMRLRNHQGVTVIHSSSEYFHADLSGLRRKFICTIPAHTLASGTYFLRAGLFVRGCEVYQQLDDVVCFGVDAGNFNSSVIGADRWQWLGVTSPRLVDWTATSQERVPNEYA